MDLLFEIISILALAAIVVFFCQKLKIPSIVGFLLTGFVAGPYGIGIITNIDEVDVLAEIGIVLLLFTIGMEFSLKKLFQIKKSVFMGGSLQVFLTIGVCYILALAFGMSYRIALFVGILMAISSTAIILKLLQERAEMDTPYGQTTLGILIFQDIIIVPLMLLVPLLAGVEFSGDQSAYLFLGKIILAVLGVVILTKWLVPGILYQITKTRNRELFLLSILVIGFSIAWLSHTIGLSLALGAFLAGLIISESEYSHQALGTILPFRDIFLSIFFISIGMLVDLSFLVNNFVPVLAIGLAVLLIKSIIAGLATLALGYTLRTAILVGFALSQVGEFSFLLSKAGLTHGLLTSQTYQMFLAVTVFTMGASPLMLALAKRLAAIVANKPFLTKRENEELDEDKTAPNDHLLIIGFGLNGRNLSLAASRMQIPHSIIEMNPETVRSEKAKGVPIFFGDATNEEVLCHVGACYARVSVVAINDASATRRIVELLRRINPKLSIIVRTRFVKEVKSLYKLGASDVIPEEFETAVEIFTRVMRKYLLSKQDIDKFTREIRSESYEMLRTPSITEPSFEAMRPLLNEVEINVLEIGQDSILSGKTLKESEFRSKYNITILSIERNREVLPNPDGDNKILLGDKILVMGKPVDLVNLSKILI